MKLPIPGIILYSYCLGVMGGLLLCAFIIQRYRRKKNGNLHNRHSINIYDLSIKRVISYLHKRLSR